MRFKSVPVLVRDVRALTLAIIIIVFASSSALFSATFLKTGIPFDMNFNKNNPRANAPSKVEGGGNKYEEAN
jgi:hypothetical protein